MNEYEQAWQNFCALPEAQRRIGVIEYPDGTQPAEVMTLRRLLGYPENALDPGPLNAIVESRKDK